MPAVNAELARSAKLQSEICSLAVSASRNAEMPSTPAVLLPALNALIDMTATRAEAARLHPPLVIFVMLGALTLACSLFAGFDMAARKRLHLLHSAGFALVLALTMYIIMDLEYPRLGLIQMTDSDQALVDLRKTMN